MVMPSIESMLRVWLVLWSLFLVWPGGDVRSVAYATDPTARNETGPAGGPTIVGRVMYRGPVPVPISVQPERDHEVCGQLMTLTTLAVDAATHGVRDAIVHVGAAQDTVDSSSAQVSVVQNKQCAFHPRVATVRVGAQMELKNDDPVMHNTNVALNNGTILNVALVPGGVPVKKPLRKEGLYVVKCNVHKFMQAYRYIFSDSLFDQTTDSGQFRIQGLSPGVHTVSVWHETLGVLHKEIQVPLSGTLTVDLEFK